MCPRPTGSSEDVLSPEGESVQTALDAPAGSVSFGREGDTHTFQKAGRPGNEPSGNPALPRSPGSVLRPHAFSGVVSGALLEVSPLAR